MPVTGKFELNVTTNTQEELDKIAEAIYNGFAENVIKERVLWSAYAAPTASAPPAQMPTVPTPTLERVATKAKERDVPVTPAAPVKHERSSGVLGRGRMRRG